MSSEQPFTIAVPDERLKQLRAKLDLVTFPDELADAGWDYGAPLADIRRLVSRWKDGFDWRKQEVALNAELPQFTRDIDIESHGVLNIHYVHKKSNAEDAVPLLFVHGWPGSFIEVRKILPLLTDTGSSDHPTFHVVTLGLPGYGFSEAPTKKGFGLNQYAEVGHKLMLALGYQEYATQGGDWGSIITQKIAVSYGGRHCKVWHSNFPLGDPPHPLYEPLRYLSHMLTPSKPYEKAWMARAAQFHQLGNGYLVEQATQPQTLGYSLADSPVGLLAWIYEKLVNWTDSYAWEDDEVLTWISIYVFSRAGPAASVRIYYELAHGGNLVFSNRVPSTVLTGFSYFPKELFLFPMSWTRGSGRVVYQKRHERGGHFAAHERPEDLVSDLREMFKKDGPCFGVITSSGGHNTTP